MASSWVDCAPQRAVDAEVADESDARPGEYWTKTYVGKVTPDGEFEVVVSEPSESNGKFKTWFAFENGAQTGDGIRAVATSSSGAEAKCRLGVSLPVRRSSQG
jgi:hypothetical protein